MKKPTINQQLWKSIIAQSQKALAQITKHTGEIFDESVFYIERPARVTKKSLERLKETELKFIRTKTEEVIHNLQPKEAEELTRKIRTREQYIRHPRISATAEREHHPLTPEERSARAKKAWKTRWERMTLEEQIQYRETFKERMKKGKQAKELERQGFVPPPEIEEAVPEEDYAEVMGVPLTAEEAEKYYTENDIYETDLIDYGVEQAIEALYSDPFTFEDRIPQLRNLLLVAKVELGEAKYYAILSANADDILGYSKHYLQYKDPTRAHRDGFIPLEQMLLGRPLSIGEMTRRATMYDTEMENIE